MLGIGLLGTLVADRLHFGMGMHTGLAIVAGAFLIGAALPTQCAQRPADGLSAGTSLPISPSQESTG